MQGFCAVFLGLGTSETKYQGVALYFEVLELPKEFLALRARVLRCILRSWNFRNKISRSCAVFQDAKTSVFRKLKFAVFALYFFT